MDTINSKIEGVLITPLKIIERTAGNILHCMKATDNGFSFFGEAYFTFIQYQAIKGWKRHHQMILNLTVPSGEVLFVLYDDRKDSPSFGKIMEISLSPHHYFRLTVPPDIWIAFKGLGKGESIVLNIASIEHYPEEADSVALENLFIPYQWP